MLLATKNIKTSTFDIVSKSIVPYQLLWQPETRSISAGMLVQDDLSLDAALSRFGYQLRSEEVAEPDDFIVRAKSILTEGNAFMMGIKPPWDFEGRHAVVIVGFLNSGFIALDPDGRLPRDKDHEFSEVKDRVVLRFTEKELAKAVSRDDGKKPIIGQILASIDENQNREFTKEIFERSNKAFQFYKSATKDSDFGDEESIYAVFSVIKPILLDLRVAIEIRDEYLGKESDIAIFLKGFESDFLALYRIKRAAETIPNSLVRRLNNSLIDSYPLLEKHLVFEQYQRLN